MKITFNFDPEPMRSVPKVVRYKAAALLARGAIRLTGPFFVVGAAADDLGIADDGPAMDALLKFADAVVEETM